MVKTFNLEGQKFGRLLATNQTKRLKTQTFRLCICDCGKETWVLTHALLSGHTKACGCLRTLPSRQAAKNSLMLDYKHGARKRGLEWNLSYDDFITLTTDRCYFCGCLPYRVKSKPSYNGSFVYNGIDRLNNDLGYIKENCVTCCWICNNAKGDLSLEEFTQWLERVRHHE